jgi:pimeloyl-ACP methyl ester carboxylesterase
MNGTTVQGATIAWTDTGAGEPTLLLHAGVFADWYAPLATRLPGRVVRMVRAGYTDGPPPPGLVDITAHAAHAAALLESLDAGPATVVAHSSGCIIALQLAHDRPDLVSRLVLSEPPLIDPLLDPADIPGVGAQIGPAMGAAMGAAAAGDAPAAFAAFMTAVCGPEHRAVLADVLGPAGLARAEQQSAFFFANEVPAMGRWTPVDPAAVGTPTLLVQGGASPAPTHRLVARLAGLLPHGEVATIGGATHLLPLTHPDELAAAIGQSTPGPAAMAALRASRSAAE